MSQRAIWIGTALIFVVILVIGVAAALAREWYWATNHLRNDVEATARAMQVHAEQGVGYARQALDRAADMLQGMDRHDPVAAEVAKQRLQDIVQANPAMGTIWVVDGEGESWLDNSQAAVQSANVRQRSYFAVHLRPDAPSFYIGPAELGTLRPRPRFTLSRAVRLPDGRLKAVITAGVDVSYFRAVYDRVRDNSGISLLALNADGDILATSSDLKPDVAVALSRSVWPAASATGVQHVGENWVLSAARVDNLPLVVAVAGDMEQVRVAWGRRAVQLALLGAAMMTGFAGLCALGLRSVGRETQARLALKSAVSNLEKEVAARTADLADAAVRARLIADSVPAAIAYVDRQERYGFVNQGYRTIMGRDPEGILGRSVEEVLGPSAYEDARAAIRQVLSGTPARLDVRRSLAHGLRHLSISYTPHILSSGEVAGFYSMIVDTTEQKETEERLQLLIAELNHRVRNVLAVGQSLVNQTLRQGRPLEEAREVLHGRFAALAQAVDVLTSSDWRSADLGALARGSLAAVIDRIDISGDDVSIEPRQAQLIALLFYELASNAAKHGALSEAGGRVDLGWSRTEADGLRLMWRERGGPAAPTSARKGFGGALLDHIVPHELRGRAVRRFEPDGLVYELEVPAGTGPEAGLARAG